MKNIRSYIRRVYAAQEKRRHAHRMASLKRNFGFFHGVGSVIDIAGVNLHIVRSCEFGGFDEDRRMLLGDFVQSAQHVKESVRMTNVKDDVIATY